MHKGIVQANLLFDTQRHVGQIDRRIFGGFVEHMGRAVYEGIYDPGNPLSDELGLRQDVLQVLRPLNIPLVRYPGGNFVSNYRWTDGIGPRTARPVRPDFAWKSIETNQFGTDEFMEWCRCVGTSPLLAVNLGTGTAAEAAALLEYCNLPRGTYWADQRAANGHAEPYGVKVWCLGNEMDGEWQAGHVPASVYAQRANEASRLMKGLDPAIETVACGSSGLDMATYLTWDRAVLEQCWETIDYLSLHRYSGKAHHDSAWFLAEGSIIERILEDYAGLLSYMRGVKKSQKRVFLSFDEWNVWYKNWEMDGHRQRAPHLLEEIYTLEDALVCSQYLTSFLRHADIVKIACLAQLVNVIAPVLTRQDGLLKQSIYYPFALFSQYAHGISLIPVMQSPTYTAGERGEQSVLDAAASYDEDTGMATFFLINRHQEKELPVEIVVTDRQVEHVLRVEIMGGGDVQAANTWEQPGLVQPRAGQAKVTDSGRVLVRVPAPGLAVVRTHLVAR